MYAAHTDVHGMLRARSEDAVEHAPAARRAPPPPPNPSPPPSHVTKLQISLLLHPF